MNNVEDIWNEMSLSALLDERKILQGMGSTICNRIFQAGPDALRGTALEDSVDAVIENKNVVSSLDCIIDRKLDAIRDVETWVSIFEMDLDECQTDEEIDNLVQEFKSKANDMLDGVYLYDVRPSSRHRIFHYLPELCNLAKK